MGKKLIFHYVHKSNIKLETCLKLKLSSVVYNQNSCNTDEVFI